jgi:steroid 5-alpha reductase family enzyme
MTKKNTGEGIIFGFDFFHLAGLTVWLTGFLFEVIGDMQL